MSETQRFGTLLDVCLGLANPKANAARLDDIKPLVESSSPLEVMLLVDAIVERMPSMDEVKPVVSRMLNLFGKVLNSPQQATSLQSSYLKRLVAENRRISAALAALRPHVAKINKEPSVTDNWAAVGHGLHTLQGFLSHYTDKENILFPVVERHVPQSGCLKLMWAIHDDIRSSLKAAQALIADQKRELKTFNTLVGAIFFDMGSMIMREEKVLLPALAAVMPHSALAELDHEQFGEKQVDATRLNTADPSSDGGIDLGTGNPTARQLIQIFNHLPVDITLIDRADRVVYFNTPEHRIFGRTAAVVGRTVQNCHPPKSVDVVNRILASFRAKTQNRAEFRLELGGRYILITYLALYDSTGAYDGTLEVSQDITRLRTLQGQKRLLDW